MGSLSIHASPAARAYRGRDRRATLGAKLRAIALVASLPVMAACGGAPRPVETAHVRFLLEPSSARVYEDDRFIGAGRVLSRRPAAFRPGPRYFTITADGFFPHDVEVDLPEGLTTIRLRLRPVPP